MKHCGRDPVQLLAFEGAGVVGYGDAGGGVAAGGAA